MYGCPITRLCRVLVVETAGGGCQQSVVMWIMPTTRGHENAALASLMFAWTRDMGLSKVCCCRSPSRVGHLEVHDSIGMDGQAETQVDRL